MGTGISRRGLLRAGGGAAALAALGGGLTACGGTGAGSAGGDLTMAWWGSDERHAAYRKALAYFGRKHPGIRIRPRYSGYDGYFDRFNTQVAGGGAPDLVQMDTALVASYARQGVLTPLDTYVGASLDLTGFSRSLLAAGTVDGTLYGVPSGLGVNVVTLNVTGLADLGLTGPDREWTWSDLRTYAAKVYRASGGKAFGVDDGGGSTNQAFDVYVRERGQNLYTSDGRLGFTQDTLREWWEYWAEMRAIHACGGGALTSAAHNDLTRNAVVLGKAMITFDSGLDNSAGRLTGATLDFVPTPRGDWAGAVEGNFVNGGVLLSATARGRRAADSVAIMDFFAQDPTAIRDMALLRGIPPTAKARALVAPRLSANDRRSSAAAAYVADRVAKATDAPPPPVAPPAGADQVTELLFQSNLAVSFGRSSIASQLRSFFDQAESILSQAS